MEGDMKAYKCIVYFWGFYLSHDFCVYVFVCHISFHMEYKQGWHLITVQAAG